MKGLDLHLPLIQNVDLADKIVLVRLDHNVVEKGVIKDSFRIDSTFGLLYYIISKGARPIIMTHVGRTRDKKTGHITADNNTSVAKIVEYLNRKLNAGLVIPDLSVENEKGITSLDEKVIKPLLYDLKAKKIGGIYLPNTRWFAGEESKDDKTSILADQLASLADLYVNDAFGSWQPHASTYDVAFKLPACAGFLMQKELIHLDEVLNPGKKPFLAIVAGSKFDTKIGPLSKLYEKADYLMLGGVIYNAFLAAKYGITPQGLSEEDIKLAKELVEKDRQSGKILEPNVLVESQALDKRDDKLVRKIKIADFKAGQSYKYFLDVAPESFDEPHLAEILSSAQTIFVNAVLGLVPHFPEGSRGLYAKIAANESAKKLLAGGDTLTEFKNLNPGLYLNALDDPNYYFFTGGGTVLTAIEAGSPYGLKPIEALMKR